MKQLRVYVTNTRLIFRRASEEYYYLVLKESDALLRCAKISFSN